MPEDEKTFGDFFNKVEELLRDKTIDANFFVEEWVKTVSKENSERIKAMPLTIDLVVAFAEDMAAMYAGRIINICTDALYNRTVRDGHSFLYSVHRIAKELGLEIDIKHIDTPLTPTEALASGLSKKAL